MKPTTLNAIREAYIGSSENIRVLLRTTLASREAVRYCLVSIFMRSNSNLFFCLHYQNALSHAHSIFSFSKPAREYKMQTVLPVEVCWLIFVNGSYE